ncbi:MAG: hypothetical protein JWP00_3220 [Chloroflexi bacterium]|jgi:hypothetical protein|nr:hypothetical protein [Chloroflexota bacterium]
MSYLDKKLDQATTDENKLTQEEEEVLGKVLDALRQIKFGYVQITIQDNRVVQIDRTEKQRLSSR